MEKDEIRIGIPQPATKFQGLPKCDFSIVAKNENWKKLAHQPFQIITQIFIKGSLVVL